MSRVKALELIRSAGARGDQALFLRLYTANRIAYATGLAAYREGVAWAASVNSNKERG